MAFVPPIGAARARPPPPNAAGFCWNETEDAAADARNDALEFLSVDGSLAEHIKDYFNPIRIQNDATERVARDFPVDEVEIRRGLFDGIEDALLRGDPIEEVDMLQDPWGEDADPLWKAYPTEGTALVSDDEIRTLWHSPRV